MLATNRLGQRFAGGDQRKLNKAIHLLRSFAGMVASGSKPCSGSLSMDGTAGHFAGNIRDQLLAESGDP